jgi:hypothetical protein
LAPELLFRRRCGIEHLLAPLPVWWAEAFKHESSNRLAIKLGKSASLLPKGPSRDHQIADIFEGRGEVIGFWHVLIPLT